MRKKRPLGARLIRVMPAANSGEELPPVRGKSDNTMIINDIGVDKILRKGRRLPEIPDQVKKIEGIDSSCQGAEAANEENMQDDFPTTEEETIDIEEVATEEKKAKEQRSETRKKKKRVKKNAVLPLDVTTSDYLEGTHQEPMGEANIGEPQGDKGKKKKTKKKKSKKNKKEKEQENKEPESAKTKKEPEQEIVAAPLQPNEKADDKKKGRKLPCCFGFIATWLAKRKQKRRDKKKKAIADRTSTPELVQYGHMKSKGGEAFVVEVDSRPMIQKPLLPPIQKSSGPIRRADYKLQDAEARRNEELAKKKEAARKHKLKKAECLERKEDADFHFRKKARLTIRYKQADAERNRNNLSRRAITRPISVQSSSSESVTNKNGPDARKVDSVDSVFKF